MIKSKTINLSNHKFSSNVIELCLKSADVEMRNEFVKEIRTSEKLSSKLFSLNHILGLMRNSFGNYVVQSTLRISEGAEKDLLMKALY